MVERWVILLNIISGLGYVYTWDRFTVAPSRVYQGYSVVLPSFPCLAKLIITCKHEVDKEGKQYARSDRKHCSFTLSTGMHVRGTK